MRSGEDRHHHGTQIRLCHDGRVLVVLADGLVHPALAIGLGHHVVQDLLRGLPKAPYVFGHSQLLLRRGPPPGVEGVGHCKFTQLFCSFIRHAQKVQRDGERDFIKHLPHQIGTAFVDKAVHVLARQGTHGRLVLGQHFRQKGVHQQAAALHVVGLILIDHGAVHGVAVTLENLRRLWRRGCDLLQRDGR